MKLNMAKTSNASLSTSAVNERTSSPSMAPATVSAPSKPKLNEGDDWEEF